MDTNALIDDPDLDAHLAAGGDEAALRTEIKHVDGRDKGRGVQFNFTLPDGQVAVYRTGWGEGNLMYFMCIDPIA